MKPVRVLAMALILGAALVVVCASPALAQVAPDGDVSPDAPVSAFLTINNSVVLVLTGLVVPLVNGLLLRPENPGWVKVLVANLLATVVHGFSQTIQADGAAILTQEWFLGLFITLGTMIATYLGVWKPMIDPDRTFPGGLRLGSPDAT